MLLAVTQSVDNWFYSFIVLCENYYFLISNLHCSLTLCFVCSELTYDLCHKYVSLLS